MSALVDAVLDLPQSVALLVTPGFSLLPLALCVEIMRLANLIAGIDIFSWDVVASVIEPISSLSGLPVTPSASLENFETTSIAIVLGGSDIASSASQETMAWLNQHYQTGGTVAAIGAGVRTLESSGIVRRNDPVLPAEDVLSPLRWSDTTDLCLGDPSKDWVYVCEREQAAGELLLTLIADQVDPDLADSIRDELGLAVKGEQSCMVAGQEQRSIDGRVTRVIGVMRSRLAEPCTISDICAKADVDETTARRLFKRQLGTSPSDYYVRLRLERGRHLLSFGRARVKEVARAVGFADSASFCHAFRRRYGFSPGRLRGQGNFSIVH